MPLPDGYLEAARELILADFSGQADARGLLEVVFSRVYVLARKPRLETDDHARGQ